MPLRPARRAAQLKQYDVEVEVEASITPQLSCVLLASFIRYILFSRNQTFTTVDQLERHYEVRAQRARGAHRHRRRTSLQSAAHTATRSPQEFLEIQAQSQRKRVPNSHRKLAKVRGFAACLHLHLALHMTFLPNNSLPWAPRGMAQDSDAWPTTPRTACRSSSRSAGSWRTR